MQVCWRYLRMYRLCGGGDAAGARTKPQIGVIICCDSPLTFHQSVSTAPYHGAPLPACRKTWSFIRDSVSYDTFFTMKRLIERSQRPDEVLRWIAQNPSKVSHSHLAVALQRIAQLLQAPPPALQAPAPKAEAPLKVEGGMAKAGDRKWTLEHRDFLSLCDAIERETEKLDNFSLVTSLYSAANIGLSSDLSMVRSLESECVSRVAQFNQKDLSMVFSSVMRLHPLPSSAPPPPLPHEPDPAPSASLDLPTDVGLPHAEGPAGDWGPSEVVLQGPSEGVQGPSEGEHRPSEIEQGYELPSPPHGQPPAPDVGLALAGACLSGLERSLERERHPQTLFLLLAYYRGRWRELQSQSQHNDQNAPTSKAELLLTNSAVREQEMALLDEMLAACASEASNRSLELIFTSNLFHQNRQERFIRRLAEELPLKVDALSPNTVSLIAKYAARHRLRETLLLDTIADFLLRRVELLDCKVIQRLVFPFSRMNYVPQNAPVLFSRLEQVLELKALASPLATVNILMSLFQLKFYPQTVLQRVFSPGFIHDLTHSPYSGIVRRYLSLLDSAVELEFRDYSGPRLSPVHKVLMFDQALTADEANRKYSYKGLVAEALRQLLGENCFKQDQILAPGYTTDFLLWVNSCRRVLPIGSHQPCDSFDKPCHANAPGWQMELSGLTPGFQKLALEAPSERAPLVGAEDHMTMNSFYTKDLCKDQDVHRVVLSVNDKWHYCHNSQVLVGSRAMRDRHLRLLGHIILQLPYHELEKLNGIEDVKIYLQQKLNDLQL